ncbi:hypothetical protein PRZ48_014308 [Zasmidium cellare]|uniref:Uncharacterized protein n=1 Tax=Zasmidium cellare TaxID=395010 RepID=A0ABR0E0J6_ZASCE|nr:hypothetical protein PRZ48_014308 [Zasmidium cellare]
MLSKRSLSAPGCCRTKPLLKPSRQKPPQTKNTPITEHIESLVLALITTINTRAFNPHNPLIDPAFTGSIRYPWGGREPTSWPGTLAIFAALTQQYPAYAIVRPMMYTEIYGESNVYAGVGRPRKREFGWVWAV